jgi:hypothetical protein
MHEPGHRDRSLTAALRALAEDDATRGASPDVEARLLAEVRSIDRTRRHAYAKTAAVAAGLLLAIALPVSQLAKRAANVPHVVDVAAEPRAEPAGGRATDFLPLTYSTVPVTGGQIVTLRVPEMALASFGLAPADFVDGTPSTVLAEVLVGEDGLARAVRFVRPVSVAQEEQPQ